MATPLKSYASYKEENKLTMWEVFERAAKDKYGSNIKVVKAPWVTKQINSLRFEISVIKAGSAPREKSRSTVDIHMKEYINTSDTAEDETIVRISKKRSKKWGSRYQFSSTSGVNWGVSGNIGAQVGHALAGGSTNLGASYGKSKSTTTENEQSEEEGIEFNYEQEEKISVQPHTQVNALITTYAMKYEQNYTIKLSLPADLVLNVMYKNRCNIWCCGANWGKISARELLRGLPGYDEDEGVVSFLQDGTLSWVGEGSKIDKTVETLSRSLMQQVPSGLLKTDEQ